VTTLNPALGMDGPAHLGLRLAAFLFAALLGLQCVWLLAAELIRPNIDRLPTDMASATSAAKRRDAAAVAASIGAVRGDLWAESAYTFADLLWPERPAGADSNASALLQRARNNLDRAIVWGPQQSGAWLLLAALGQQFRLTGTAPVETLKMSYYTGPSERSLIPLRLQVAVRGDKFDDFEIRQFVTRDLRLLLAHNQISAIADAYKAASPAGKSFVEQAIKDIDPSALVKLRTATRGSSVPD
jgi:hypothetical protein